MTSQVDTIPRRLPAAVTLALMSIIAVLSLTPDRDNPGDSAFVWLVHVTPTTLQKLMHIACYGSLAVVWWWTLWGLSSTTRRLFAAFAIAVAFGAAMEVLQAFVPGRFGSAYDVVLNGVGALVGLAVVHALRRADTRMVRGSRNHG
jgi:VanZ family protein